MINNKLAMLRPTQLAEVSQLMIDTMINPNDLEKKLLHILPTGAGVATLSELGDVDDIRIDCLAGWQVRGQMFGCPVIKSPAFMHWVPGVDSEGLLKICLFDITLGDFVQGIEVVADLDWFVFMEEGKNEI